ncbi:GNAT family N-acetyltransferase [[Clostridium] polysaccharolyticum]|uniref:Acetyltransferase (GNAT) domain-containing protein n=1 Tax=[Clostridium] polysaccharolyticum TaxID=29364 RepID=A0A1I0FGZ5_9FIRM|nr:GNAT family N-acetyltransferase [[Clostridium] polysaccharolyticum]SET56799.1 Acetyltransferase (GNAT) domain-containing protein [[Clostridium] polysaccharolyticum]
MNIRIMTIEDYDQVYALWQSCKGMGLNPADDSKEGIEKYLKRNPATCYVAEEDGRIAGVILAGHDGRRGFLHHTAVSELHRHKGIAAKLVDAALSISYQVKSP